MSKKNGLYATLLLCTVALSACQPAAESTSSSTTNSKPQSDTSTTNQTSNNNQQPDTPVTNNEPSTDNQTSDKADKPADTPNAEGNNQSAASDHLIEGPTLATEIYNEAKDGKIFFCELAIGTEKSRIIQQWGEPDPGSKDGVLTYKDRFVLFGIDPATQKVTFISSDHPKFQMILIKQVQKELGKPAKEEKMPDENLMQAVYQAGKYRVTYVYDERDHIVRYVELIAARQKNALQQTMQLAAEGKSHQY